MILPLLLLLFFQLAGEVLSRALALPLPGPLVGMVALVIALVVAPSLGTWLRQAGDGLLANLSLLFVPAGVGVASQGGLVAGHGLALVLAIGLSTAAAIAVGALVFQAVAQLTDPDDGAAGPP